MAEFEIIAASCDLNSIGFEGNIQWRCPADLQLFVTSTHGGVVIMGRVTFQSIGRCLKDRTNVVISSSDVIPGAREQPHRVFRGLVDALAAYKGTGLKVWVIGGAQLYAEALTLKGCVGIQMSKIPGGPYKADRWFPDIDEELFGVQSMQAFDTFQVLTYRAKNHVNKADSEYARLVRSVLEAPQRLSRNSVVNSLFAPDPLRFDLSDGNFPLLTTKKVAFRLVAEELFWFLRGSTNARELSDKGIFIWKGNADEFYNREGTTAKYCGDLGKVYGHQLKKFGEKEADDGFAEEGFGVPHGAGFDQIRYILDEIRQNPTSRRIMFSFLNPAEMFGKPNEVALPCCHCMAQFYVNDGYLSCHMYQRSCDLFLGACFNVASYALLTELIAKSCSLNAKELVMSFGDVHIYNNALEQIQQQITRSSYEPPRVEISDRVVGTYLEDLTMDDVKLQFYKSHPTIKAEMVV